MVYADSVRSSIKPALAEFELWPVLLCSGMIFVKSREQCIFMLQKEKYKARIAIV
jgi:hypothetical protein